MAEDVPSSEFPLSATWSPSNIQPTSDSFDDSPDLSRTQSRPTSARPEPSAEEAAAAVAALVALAEAAKEARKLKNEAGRVALSENLAIEKVVLQLEKQPLFEKCGRTFLGRLVELAERREVAAGEAIDVANLDALIVIERGALLTMLGDGPPEHSGPGVMLNAVGMLSAEDEFRSGSSKQQTVTSPTRSPTRQPSRPTQHGPQVPGCYEIEKYPGSAPDLYSMRRGKVDRKELAELRSDGTEFNDHVLNFFNLCPYAATTFEAHANSPASAHLQKRRLGMRRLGMISDEMPIQLVGAEPGVMPVYGTAFTSSAAAAPVICQTQTVQVEDEGSEAVPFVRDADEGYQEMKKTKGALKADDFSGGATILLIRMKNVMEIYNKAGAEKTDRESATQIEQNWKTKFKTWRSIERVKRYLFPQAPAEVTWQLAEMSSYLMVDAGTDIVCEDTVGEEGDSIFVIEQGIANVEKRVGGDKVLPSGKVVEGEAADDVRLGFLKQGAIIGDLCLMGSGIPRPASVRAKTRVEYSRLPASGLQKILQRWPGLVTKGTEIRLSIIASMMRERLPTRAEVAASLHLFRSFDLHVVNEIASSSEQLVYFVGESVVQEGSTEGALHVLGHGKCMVEVKGVGIVADVPTGNCFGERTLLGIAKGANASVRVCSPFAIVLHVTREAVNAVLDKHPTEKQLWEEIKLQPLAGRVKGMGSGLIELFRSCSVEFLDILTAGMRQQGYLAGQTIVLEGIEEKDPCMYVLTGGQIVCERKYKEVAEMTVGSTFGELAMMGVTQSSAVTVRALTYCSARLIPRSVFRAALQGFPQEEEYFKKCIHNPEAGSNRTPWPLFKELNKRFTYLVDLYQRPVQCVAGSLLSDHLNEGSAVLLVDGILAEEGPDGQEVKTHTGVTCLFEEALLGVECPPCRLVARTDCEVYILAKTAWDRVLAELSDEQDAAELEVRRSCVRSVKEDTNIPLGCPTTVLFKSSLFRHCSTEFCEFLAGRLQPRVFASGDDIVPFRLEGDSLFFCLKGHAKNPRSEAALQTDLLPGDHFGEAALLGVTPAHEHQLTATETCICEELLKEDFEDALNEFPEETEMFDYLCDEAMSAASKVSLREPGMITPAALDMLLQKSTGFRKVDRGFVSKICRHVRLKFYAPGDVLVAQNDTCEIGKTSFFLLCSGFIQAEGAAGVVFGSIEVGEAIGEIGAFGIKVVRTATTRAKGDKLVCCAEFPGSVIKAALEFYPNAFEPLLDAFHDRELSNTRDAEKRHKWLEEVAMPNLREVPLLKNCSEDFLMDLAHQLTEKPFNAGSEICTVGDNTSSMLVLVKGEADLKNRSERHLGRLTVGASFGDVAALGLLPNRMATLVAKTDCLTIEVPKSALEVALLKRPELRDGFEQLVQSRRDQVLTGLPITCLDVQASADDVMVRSIALQAERFILAPNEIWQPLSDSNPGGSTVAIIAVGRAKLVIAKGGAIAMHLEKGSLIHEGLAAKYNSVIRAETHCEGYRIREHDVLLNEPPQKGWYWRYKVCSSEAHKKMKQKLAGVWGLIGGLNPHTRDVDLMSWTSQRTFAIARSQRLRRDPVGERLRESIQQPRVIFEETDGWMPPRKQDDDDFVMTPTMKFNRGIWSYPTGMLPNLCNKELSRPGSSASLRSGFNSRGSSRPASRTSRPVSRSQSTPHFEDRVTFRGPGAAHVGQQA